MHVETLFKIINSDFYTGVPDSKLKALSTFLMGKYNLDKNHHIIAANEGNAVGIAAGVYLSTKKIPVVYMQNSGEGNAVNPIASLLNEEVYNIPMIFIIGWRGEPGEKDEPQHKFQGKITLSLLDILNIKYFIIDKDTTDEEAKNAMIEFDRLLKEGKQVAFVVKKDGIIINEKFEYKNDWTLNREDAIEEILDEFDDAVVVSTTGKISREVFEIREKYKEHHDKDFLTVGSMGHSSSIALGIALNKENKKVICLDGDGACLMHMGAMATISKYKPKNMIHIVLNNEAHESVGGMPTTNWKTNFCEVAKALGYEKVYEAKDKEELKKVLEEIKNEEKNNHKLTFIEIKCKLGARAELGRPTTSPEENKINFMKYLNE